MTAVFCLLLRTSSGSLLILALISLSLSLSKSLSRLFSDGECVDLAPELPDMKEVEDDTDYKSE